MKYSIWIVICLQLLSQVSWCQKPDISYKYLTYRDGLPDYGHPEAMIEDQLGRIWIGYSNGLYRFEGQHVVHIPAVINDSLKLSENHVQSFLLDDENTLWVGTRNSGICLYNPLTDQFKRILPEKLGGQLPAGRIWDMDMDEDGILWISAKPGLIRCDQEKMEFNHFLYESQDKTAFEIEFFNTIRTCEPDPVNKDILWLGTRAGLLSFSKSKQVFRKWDMTVPISNTNNPGLDFMIISMVFMDENNLWCSTWAGGLLHFNTSTKEWDQFLDPLLPQEFDITYCIQKKDDKHLWLGSHRMFGVFNIETHEFDYNDERKDQSEIVHWSQKVGNFLFSKDSLLYVAATHRIGISEDFKSTEIKPIQEKPFVSNIEVNNLPFLAKESHPYLSHLTLEPDMNTIRFTLSWPMHPLRDDLQYRFKLNGRNRNWNSTQNQPSIQYTNLKGGKYTFKYQSSIDGETWVDGLNSPTFRIKILFWKHPLFIVLNVLLVFGLIYFFYHLRLKKVKDELKLKAEFEKRIGEMEMVALRSQMNPHFIFNSLNSIKSFILKEDKMAASMYLTKFSKLMRTILKNSNQKWITLEEEINALKLYLDFETMRLPDQFSYEFVIDKDIFPAAMYVPPLILQPFVENSIWHGIVPKEIAGNIWINISAEQGQLKICIIDDGIGRKKAEANKSPNIARQKSFGMNITNERLEQINHSLDMKASMQIIDLYDDYERAEGTKVIIHLPIMTMDGEQSLSL